MILQRDVVGDDLPPARRRAPTVLLTLLAVGLAGLIAARTLDQPDAPPPGAVDEVTGERPGRANPLPTSRREAPVSRAPAAVQGIEVVTVVDGDVMVVTLDGSAEHVLPLPTADGPGVVELGWLVDGVIPAVDGDRVWTVVEPADPEIGPCGLVPRDNSGAVVGSTVHYDCALAVVRETVAGFVARAVDETGEASGWLFSGGSLVRLDGWPIAVTADRVVLGELPPTRSLTVADLGSGERTELTLPPGRSSRRVALSPDGAYLAVVLTERLARTWVQEVGVYAIGTGDVEYVLVTADDTRSRLDLGWHGGTLVLTDDVLLAYLPTTDSLFRSPVELPATREAFAVRGH